MLPEPIVACVYGWGRVLRLYQDRLDVDGVTYALTELVQVRSLNLRLPGITFFNIGLRFRKKKLVLCHIAGQDNAQKLLEYLREWLIGHASGESAWGARVTVMDTPAVGKRDDRGGPNSQDRGTGWNAANGLAMPTTPPVSQLILRDHSSSEHGLEKWSRALTVPIEVPRWPYEQRERRMRRLRAERLLREYGFDVDQLARQLREGVLPQIEVPIPLLSGERAYYSTSAALCGEPLAAPGHYGYQLKDHGTLILTSERLIYLGHKSQFILGYAHLLHVSRLRRAIAFMVEYWSKRELFQVPRPLECSMYLEEVLRRFQQEHQMERKNARLGGPYMYQVYPVSDGLVNGAPTFVNGASNGLVNGAPTVGVEDIDTVQFSYSDRDESREVVGIEGDVAEVMMREGG